LGGVYGSGMPLEQKLRVYWQKSGIFDRNCHIRMSVTVQNLSSVPIRDAWQGPNFSTSGTLHGMWLTNWFEFYSSMWLLDQFLVSCIWLECSDTGSHHLLPANDVVSASVINIVGALTNHFTDLICPRNLFWTYPKLNILMPLRNNHSTMDKGIH
jgi:hypothetical protein